MTPAPQKQLDQIFEAAVVVSWSDLIPCGESGMIHVEYDFDGSGYINFLQVWSCRTRGVWNLVCSYKVSRSSSHHEGLRLENGYRSERLTEILKVVLCRQDRFLPAPHTDRPGLLQVAVPSTGDRIAADALLNQVLDHIESRDLALTMNSEVAHQTEGFTGGCA